MDDHRTGYWRGLTQEGEAFRQRQRDKSVILSYGYDAGWFTCLDNFWQATQDNKNKNKTEICLWRFRLDSFLASVSVEQQTRRQALTLQPQTDGSWVCWDNAIWFHMVSDCASAHRCRERWEKKNDMTERRRDYERERERGNNSPWCKVQDLRFLPAVLFHRRLTLAAAQSNMPLCWRGRAMGTCFFLFFFWPRHWLGMLSWAGGGYSNILSDANDPLMMQREKEIDVSDEDLQLLVHFFKEDRLFFSSAMIHMRILKNDAVLALKGPLEKSMCDCMKRSLHHIPLSTAISWIINP